MVIYDQVLTARLYLPKLTVWFVYVTLQMTMLTSKLLILKNATIPVTNCEHIQLLVCKSHFENYCVPLFFD